MKDRYFVLFTVAVTGLGLVIYSNQDAIREFVQAHGPTIGAVIGGIFMVVVTILSGLAEGRR